MYKHNKCIHGEKEYARAFVIPQVYENLFSVEDAFKKGTIFMDLYMPYHENKN